MEIITKADLIMSVPERWGAQYRDGRDPEKAAITRKLRKLKPCTKDEITETIGNNTWTMNICDECEEDKDLLVLLGRSSYYGDSTVGVCKDCLVKALTEIGHKTI